MEWKKVPHWCALALARGRNISSARTSAEQDQGDQCPNIDDPTVPHRYASLTPCESSRTFAGVSLLDSVAPARCHTRQYGALSYLGIGILLANANDVDSLRSTRADLRFLRGLGDVAYVVATYMSMAGEELGAKQVVRTLGLDASTPVLRCHLRDRESVVGVVRAALDLAAARSAG